MMARVSDNGTASDAFPVTNGTKQGCVMAPLLFGIVFSAMLYDAFRNYDRGCLIRFRKEGGIFNLRGLKAKTKVSTMMIRELQFADDCALISYSQEDIQVMVDNFARETIRYGLNISIRKTEVMFQPKPKGYLQQPARN